MAEEGNRPAPWICRVIDGISDRLSVVVCWLMLLTVSIGAYNSLAGSLRKLDIKLTNNALIELQWYLFSIIFLLGASYTLKENAHVRVDVMYDRLSPNKRRVINIVGHLVFLLPFCAFMVYMSLGPVANSFRILEVSPDPHGLPRYLIKVFIPIAFGWLFVQGVSELIKQINGLGRTSPPGPDPAEAAGLGGLKEKV